MVCLAFAGQTIFISHMILSSNRDFFKDSSLSAWVAGSIATLISCTGPIVILVQAAQAGGLSEAELSSWIWAVRVGGGVLSVWLSLYFKAPFFVAWSIPGAALLVSVLPDITFSEAIGAYIIASIIVLLFGATGVFDRFLSILPGSIGAGLQAGILLSFSIDTFRVLPEAPLIVLSMVFTYIVMRRLSPRYAVAMVLFIGLTVVIFARQLDYEALRLAFSVPVWTWPEFNLLGTLSLAVPLALVSLSGQFMPGMSIMRMNGYRIPARSSLIGCGFLGVLLAPFGAHGFNLASVTLALCASPEAHPDKNKRYVAAVVGGVLFALFGVASTTFVVLFTALPPQLIAALAGLALMGPLLAGLMGTVSDSKDREAGLFCFLVTASGISLHGLSAPFWGVIVGLGVYLTLGSGSVRADKSARDK